MPKKYFPKKRAFRKKTMTKKPKVTKGIKQYVNRAIHRQIEDKRSLLVQNVNNIRSYVYDTTMGVTTCLPTINIIQGVGQSGRIGNTVHIRSLYFNFCLYPLAYDPVSNPQPKPQEVLIFLGKIKGQRDRTPATSDFQKIWQNGNSSAQPYSDLRDLTQSVNKDYWTIYKMMRFKIGNAVIDASGNNAVAQYYSNNDFNLNVVRRMNITKFVPKILKFNDTTASPTNDNLYMWHTCVNADGSVANNTIPIAISYSFQCAYEDA